MSATHDIPTSNDTYPYVTEGCNETRLDELDFHPGQNWTTYLCKNASKVKNVTDTF